MRTRRKNLRLMDAPGLTSALWGTARPLARLTSMIAIPITPAAYKALKAMRPETIKVSPAGDDGMIRLWLDCNFVKRLAGMRRTRESYSDVILRLEETGVAADRTPASQRTGAA
jgi:predicted CopG family antitoxin